MAPPRRDAIIVRVRTTHRARVCSALCSTVHFRHTTHERHVVGLGGMGSTAAYHLVSRGVKVLGLDRHTPFHNQGSSHGTSRVIRQAYFESSAYVPLVLRAYELWRQLEHDTGIPLLTITGGLMMGRPESDVVRGSLTSAVEHGLSHEVLDAVEIRRRYPPLKPAPDVVGLYENMAGFLHPEKCNLAHRQRAVELGATLQFGEPVFSWETTPNGDGVRVTTTRGSYHADRMVISSGPWASGLLSDLKLPLAIERQVLYWFDPLGGLEPFLPDRFPIYIWEIEKGLQFYGFPAQNEPPGGVKVAFYHSGDPLVPCTPETIDREVHPEEIARLRNALQGRVPSLDGPLLDTATCMYTTTPDYHFILGMHPDQENVVMASPCSGHGFKFASVIGEILAELAIDGRSHHPIELFSPARFAFCG